MIVFKKISWKNFLSTGNTPTIIELDKNSTTVLLGESGSGKSTLLDAIAFSLYNKPFRSINKNKIINAINQKDCLVEIEFAIDQKEYRVRRGIKPNIFEIYCNNILINQDASVKDYQLHLEKNILKFNYRSFTQIVVLGASNFVPFMLLKPNDRRLIIEELLDIQIFSAMNTLLKQKMTDVQHEFESINSKTSILNEKIQVHQQYILDLESDNVKKIESNQSLISKNLNQMNSLKEEIVSVDIKIAQQNEMLSFESELNTKVKELIDLESKLEDTRRKTNKDIVFYKNNDDCPTCKQHIEPSFKLSEIEKKGSVLIQIEDGMKQIEAKMLKLEEKKTRATAIKQAIAQYQVDKNKKQASIDAITVYIKKIENENLELLKPKNKVAEETVVLDSYRSEITALELQKDNLIHKKNLHDLASALLKDGGVKTRIIKQYLPVMNKLTNKYLSDMSFFVSFNLDENFEETIRSRGRDDFMYGNFSDGEKQRLDLALLFTWREIAKLKNSINTNLLILDEVADSYLDLESTENILQLLTSNVFKNANIILISHKNTISDKFQRVIHFKKEKGFSRTS